ncbi:hypothetical protein G3A43_07670 [Paraburkholderia aspalathi]|nr:hypothetical protein [Paraburkholderia aspalathi]MBK3780133.1 hypothetical protein [Paraburkholderia aspalathi]
MARITIGNTKSTGFVNLVSDDKKRIVIGTGSYTKGDGTKVFKESVTVFFDEKYDGEIPAKGDYVEVSGDLTVQPRKNAEDQLNATYNVRFANQLEKKAAPVKKETTTAPAGDAGDDI